MFFLVLSFFSACDEPFACTEIGCSSGLTLIIKDSYGGDATRAQGTITIDGQEYAFDCAAEDSTVICDNGIVYLQVEQGSTATYDITMGDEYDSGALTLSFEAYAPNGEGCEPVCYNDEHTIELFRSFE